MKMRFLLASIFTMVAVVSCASDSSVSDKGISSADSLRVTGMLERGKTFVSGENIILSFAKGFLGTPYAGGTLETFPVEQLVVRTDSVDCTTFVEYVLALAMTHSQELNKTKIDSADIDSWRCARFMQNLQKIRYRGGELDGYTSRLHYFSDWIVDNEKKGIVREVTRESPHEIRTINLNFMSTHASYYPFLKNNVQNQAKMQQIESRWKNFKLPYIPKERLNENQKSLQIQNGDILTLVTTTSGLDVVHVGFACWIGEELHLLHASSAKNRVLLDPLTLYQYCKNRKSQLGIRVVRVTF